MWWIKVRDMRTVLGNNKWKSSLSSLWLLRCWKLVAIVLCITNCLLVLMRIESLFVNCVYVFILCIFGILEFLNNWSLYGIENPGSNTQQLLGYILGLSTKQVLRFHYFFKNLYIYLHLYQNWSIPLQILCNIIMIVYVCTVCEFCCEPASSATVCAETILKNWITY